MKRVINYIIFVFFVVIFTFTSSPCLMQKIDKNIGNLSYKYGDLYRLCNLHRFKIPIQKCQLSPTNNSQVSKINLHLLGDSFTRHFKQTDLGTASYNFGHWDNGFNVHIDTSKYNILVIETIERYAKMRFTSNHLPVNLINTPIVTQGNAPINCNFDNAFTFKNENNLRLLCFENDWIYNVTLLFRDSKAFLQEFLFNKINPQVIIASDNNYLYLDEEANPQNEHSSYYPLTTTETDTIIAHLNNWYEKCKKMGFDEVIFTIIPNKCTIRETNRTDYNHLIEKIEQHTQNKMPFVSMYDVFVTKNKQTPLYFQSDTHWNCIGRQIWLDILYEKIANLK